MMTIQYKALGTTIEGVFRDMHEPHSLVTDIKQRITIFENTFSRFIVTSELSRINAHTGKPISISEEMFKLLSAAERLRKTTHNNITPLVGAVMDAIGYNKTFDSLTHESEISPLPDSTSLVDLNMVLDPAHQTLTLPLGTKLDVGGIGKGYLLEELAPWIEQQSKHYWLSLGGDMLVAGKDADEQPWIVGVQNPFSLNEDIGKLHMPPNRLTIATSGITKRKGVSNGIPWHHIINPSTGKPSDTDVVMATVVAPSALEAEAYAKHIIIEGSKKGMLWAEAERVAALAITKARHITMTSPMRPYAHIYET